MAEQRVRVWDWSLRVFHWTLVLLVIAMWWTAEQGHMEWHKRLGAAMVAVLVYRLIWGVIGPTSARLYTLIPRPSQFLAYLSLLKTRQYSLPFGHSPLGGLAVLALLTLLIIQTGTGLFSVDVNGLASGWFGHLISFDLGRAMADFHETSFDFLVYMIGLHLLAIITYAVLLRANLITPMITGYQTRDEGSEPVISVTAPILRVVIAATAAIGAAILVVSFGR
ncbi:MAG: cytochrome b/b6 domain-containing protein [Pseudomonadota bacterium]